MIIQTTVSTRSDVSTPWFNYAPEMQSQVALRDQLINSRPDLASQPTRDEAPDGLTCTRVQTFPTIEAFNQYVSLLKQAIPDWPAGRDQYHRDHNQTIHITVTEHID
jgi:hypothetical protein